MEHATNYEYDSLENDNDIRLLALLPGRFEDPIRCTLSTVSLDDKPAYESLSYTWGSAFLSAVLTCDSKPLKVTQNLFEGLRRLRRRRAVRVLWADAVCINQEDVEERNKQVLLMSRVYKQAKQVVVWLGEISDQNDLEDCPTKANWLITTNSKQTRVLPGSWLQHFNRPWFLRVWIIQEVVFARKVTVIHGRQKIPWRDFGRISDDVEARLSTLQGHHKVPNESHLISAIMTVYSIDDWYGQYHDEDFDGLEPCNLFQSTGSCRATDLRDKVYALLGLLPEAFREYIKPDYSLPIEQVLIDLARAFVLGVEDLDILTHAKPEVRRQGFPSWVPDLHGEDHRWGKTESEIEAWDEWLWYDQEDPEEESPSVGFDARDVPAATIEDEGRTLCLKGYPISRIRYLNEDWIDLPSHEPIPYETTLECLHSWYTAIKKHPQFAEDDVRRLPTFIDTINNDLSSADDASHVDERFSHDFTAIAVGFKYRIFRTSPWNEDSDGSSGNERRMKKYVKTSKVIQGLAQLRTDPTGFLKQTFDNIARPQVSVLKKDQYPIVPAGSDAESLSIEGNISSAKESDDSLSKPSTPSISSVDSSESDKLPMRTWKKTRNMARQNIKKPFKAWTKFARKQYEQARHPESSDSDSSDEHKDSSGKSSSIGEVNKDGGKAPTNDEHRDEKATTSDSGSDSGSDADDEAPPSPSTKSPESNPNESLPPPLPPRNLSSATKNPTPPPLPPRSPSVPAASNEHLKQHSPNQPTKDEKTPNPSSPPPASPTSPARQTSPYPSPSSSKSNPNRYKHRAKPSEASIQTPFVRQEPPTTPCTCSNPSSNTPGSNPPTTPIDLTAHLTPTEDTLLFSPSEPLMYTPRARRHIQNELELDVTMNHKRFGWIWLDGKIVLGMFPTGAMEGDVVVLLRGLRAPAVLREVEWGRYEWVGVAYVDTLWDWDFLEGVVKEGDGGGKEEGEGKGKGEGADGGDGGVKVKGEVDGQGERGDGGNGKVGGKGDGLEVLEDFRLI